MDYRKLAIVSMVCYSLVAPTMDVAMNELSSDVAVFVSNAVVLLVALGLAYAKGQDIVSYLSHEKTPHMIFVGVLIGISLLSFYRALSLGPISVVVPIYGLFVVGSAIIGIAFLDEKLNVEKSVGIALAVVSIYLIAQG